MMKPIAQKHSFGCGIACVAFVSNTTYKDALKLFRDGRRKAQEEGFLLKEIVVALGKAGLNYEYKYIKNRIRKSIYKPNTIVFIKRSKKYPYGHYISRSIDNKWMDSWINFPNLPVQSGFRNKLPDKPIYAMFVMK